MWGCDLTPLFEEQPRNPRALSRAPVDPGPSLFGPRQTDQRPSAGKGRVRARKGEEN